MCSVFPGEGQGEPHPLTPVLGKSLRVRKTVPSSHSDRPRLTTRKLRNTGDLGGYCVKVIGVGPAQQTGSPERGTPANRILEPASPPQPKQERLFPSQDNLSAGPLSHATPACLKEC